MELEIELPHRYSPRSYQRAVFTAFANGLRRFVLIWHRRSGKDKTMLNFMICRMMERVGMYWYVLPTYTQGRLIIWQGMGSGVAEGFPFLKHFPDELVADKNEQRLEITLINGSIFKIVGSDNIDSIVGANPVGVIYSEYSLQSISAWDFVRPMLTENGGWAAFIYTPRGRNHAFSLWQKAVKAKGWFVSMKNVDDTRRDSEGEDGSPVVTKEMIESERETGMSEDLIQQEYYCSFAGFREGSYFGAQMASAFMNKRITEVSHNPLRVVATVWDLGVEDETAIWFFQVEGQEVYLIDYYEQSGYGLLHYIQQVRNKPYVYSTHYAPHDIKVKEFITGKTRLEVARELGITFRVIAKIGLMDGIDSARALIPRCHFDKNKCDQGINALINYHRDFDSKTQAFREHPKHDKWSHGADAFRYLSIIVDREIETQSTLKPTEYIRDFNIFENPRQEV